MRQPKEDMRTAVHLWVVDQRTGLPNFERSGGGGWDELGLFEVEIGCGSIVSKVRYLQSISESSTGEEHAFSGMD